MDWRSLTGLVLGIGGILLGQLAEGGRVGSLLQPAGLLIVVAGTLGAVLAVGFLLMTPSEIAPNEYSRLADQELPVLVLVAGAGFAIGSLIAMAWAIVQRAFAPASPRA